MLISISAVSAENNSTDIISEINNDDNAISIDNLNDNETLSTDDGSFAALERTINGGTSATVTLENDYSYSGRDTVKAGIVINRDNLTIDGNGHTIDAKGQSRIFYVNSTTVYLKNIKFMNGNAGFDDITDGGAVYGYGDNLRIINCTFISNTASSYGGAVCSYPDSLAVIMNSTFIDNSAKYGGAVSAIYGYRQYIINSTFDSNRAGSDGGAVAIYGKQSTIERPYDDKLTVDGCLFYGNEAPYGDAISNIRSASLDIRNSILLGNTDNIIFNDVYFACANNNWFGNTYDNRSVRPNLHKSIEMDSWLYLDLVPDLSSSSAAVSISNTYNSTSAKTGTYETNRLPSIAVDVGADNSIIGIDKVVLDHSGNARFDFAFQNDTVFTASYKSVFISKKVKGGSFTELQGLINRAEDGDVIVLEKDYVYIEGVDIMTQGIQVLDKHNLVIDGNGHSVNANGKSRVFITDKESNNLVFRNLVISNGYLYSNDAGSGLYILSDDSEIVNCTFIDNVANTLSGGAAMYVHASHLSIDGCRFINNTQVYSTAGAVFLRGNDLTIKNTLFENNSAVGFAGALESYDECDIVNCTFKNNSAPYAGATFNYGNANIRDCTFIANRAIKTESSDIRVGSAGAVYGANTTITNCIFTQNNADNGAAIAMASNETIVDRCVFINNTGKYNGIIFSFAEGGKVSNSIFLNNNVDSYYIISSLYYGLVVEYNWFGNTWYKTKWNQYNTTPAVSNLATLKSWLFLNATDFAFDDKGNFNVKFTFFTYDSSTKNIIQYDDDDLPDIDLYLSSQNLTLNKNVVNAGETITGTATSYKGTLTAQCEDVKYEVPFKHLIETKIVVNSTITAYVDSQVYVPYDLIPFEYDAIPFLVSSKRITITSNDTSIAKIETKVGGIYVKGVKPGIALLTIKYNGLNVMGEDRYTPANATVLVNVTRIPTHIEFIFDPPTEEGLGDSGNIYVTARDYKNRSCYGPSLNYVNNNETVLRLAGNSYRTLAEGLANITVIYEGNSKYEPCSMDVTFKVAKKSLEISVDTNELELFIGEIYYLGPSIVGMQSPLLNCSSNDTSVATIDENGAVTAVGKGKANLTIRYDGNWKYAPSEVYVTVKVFDFETHIDVASEKEMNITDWDIIRHQLKNENNQTILVPIMSGENFTTTYSSNDTSVVRVDENGYIYAVGAGVANVTIRFNGYVQYQPSSASMIVRVIIPKNDIIAEPEVDLHVGEYYRFNATLEHKPFGFSLSDFTYEVDNASVVRVTTSGSLTGLSEGTAKVTIRYESEKYLPSNATVTVKVTKGTTKITAPDSITLYVDDSQKINANLTSLWENKNMTGLKYESSDTKVVKVDRYGQVTAVGVGQANITVKYEGSNKYYGDSVNVSVTVDYLPTEIDVGKSFILFMDQSESMDAVLTPAGIGSLIYESSDESVVRVDENGLITAVGVGEANVTVKFNGTKKYAPATQTASVTVCPLNISTSISVKKSIELNFNDSVDISAVLTPSNAGNLTYNSSDERIVKVDENGIITAVGVGKANVTVSFAGDEVRYRSSNATVLVTVNMAATAIDADDSISLFIDATVNVNATLSPAAGSLAYASSNESIVKVESNGALTAVGIGKANVTVIFTGNENYMPSSKNITVTVTQIPTEIDVGKTFALIVNENDKLNATLIPKDAGNLIYESSDESVVTVDGNGLVNAVGIGEANITVSFDGNDKYSSANRTVLVAVYSSNIPTSISVNETIELNLDDSADIGAVLTPSNAGDLTYASSDERIVKVDNNGIIKAVGIGDAKVYVKFESNDGKYLPSNATVLVKVKRIPTEITADDSITLFVDESANVNATLSPAAGSLAYASSNESVVKVDSNGAVTAVGVGKANVTVSFKADGRYLSSSKNITVTVNRIPTGIDVGKTFILVVDGTSSLNAALNPSSAGNLIYLSSDESVLTVDGDGVLTAVGAGQANVTVSFNGTDKYAPSSENVSVLVKSLDIPTNISLDNEFDLYVGDAIDIGAVLTPSNAGNLTYISSDERIVKVDNDGIITAVGVGQANLTVKFEGSKGKFLPSQATALVKVLAIPTTITADSPITVNLTENSTIKYVFSNHEAGNVEFIIETPGIVTITEGVVIANKVGKTNVTVLFKGNSNYTSSNATVEVIVVDVETSIDASDVNVNVTETAKIDAKLTPDVGKLSYESTNSSVAKVDRYGIVTGVGIGEADIIITFEGAGKYRTSNRTIHVNVLDVETDINASDITVNLTERVLIGAKLTPNVGRLYYESSDKAIVTVDASGYVIGVKVGQANITISFEGIGKYRPATKTITVNVVDVETVINASDITINVTEPATNIKATLTPNVGKLSYESTNSSIVNVTSDGAIRGISIGEADIIITFEGSGKYRPATKTVHVNVVGVPTKISVNDTISLFVGDDYSLDAVLTPKTLGKLTYESSNSSVAEVGENGKVTAKGEGTAAIAVSYAGEGKYLASNATVNVIVSRIPTSLSIDPLDMEIGDNRYIRTTLTPSISNPKFIYESNDTDVVDIDDNGFISAIAPGTAMVTITYPGDDKYLPSNTTFTLSIDIRVTSIDVESDIEIGYGESRDLGAHVVTRYFETTLPMTYSSSNPSVVSVDENGVITAHKIGNATISIVFAGEKSFAPSNATVNVVVTTRTTEISVAKDRISMYVDDESKIEAYLIEGPLNARLTYQSSNPSIVSVDSNGKLRANGEGSAIITVNYAGDDEYHSSSATVNVTVSKIPTKIVADGTFEMKVFETIDLHAVLTPQNGILTYTSSDTEIARVDPTGKLTAEATGNVVVTIKYAGDRKYLPSQKQVIVTISKVPTSINLTDITLYSGEEYRLSNILNPSGAPTRYLSYDSGDLDVFDVDSKGLITTFQEGIAELMVSYRGTDSYLPSNATAIVKVIKKTLTSDECTFNVDVSDDTGDAAFTLNVPKDATGNFVVSVDGEIYGDEDNIQNGAAVVYVDGLTPGDHRVTMRYTGDQKYFAVNNQTTIHIFRLKIDKNKDISVVYTENAVYKVHLTRDTQAMEAKTITFKINGKTYYGITDMLGYASVKLPKLPIKTYTITASYKGIKVTNKITSKHIVVAKNVNAKKTKALKIKVTLNKVNNKYLAKKKVTLKFKGKTYTGKTNNKGVVTFTIPKSVLAKLKVGKSYTYKVTYSKDTISKKIKIVK